MQRRTTLQANNARVREWGTIREDPELYNHVDLVHMLDIADLDHGTTVAGLRRPTGCSILLL